MTETCEGQHDPGKSQGDAIWALREALKIAGIYLADCNRCPDHKGIGLGHVGISRDDCGRNTKCWACWTEYLLAKVGERLAKENEAKALGITTMKMAGVSCEEVTRMVDKHRAMIGPMSQRECLSHQEHAVIEEEEEQ